MFAFALCMGMTSCKDSANKDKNDSTKTEAAADNKDGEKKDDANANKDEAEAKAPAADVSNIEGTLKDIVAKAKEEGANWSVDDWKAQFKAALTAMKPMMLQMKEIQDKIAADPSKAEEIVKNAQGLEDQYKKVAAFSDEFEEIAKQSENGKKVLEDEEFSKQVMQELGLGDLDM